MSMSVGCSSEYKTYTIPDEDIKEKHSGIITEHPRFSFEYPKSFGYVGLNSVGDVVMYSENFTQIQFTRNEKFITSYSQSLLFVNVFKDEPGKYNSISIATLAWILNNPNEKDINEQEIMIAGIQGKYFQRQVDNSEGYPLYLITYFEYSGFKWSILMVSSTYFADEAEDKFNHIIQTFKFIN